MPPEPRLTVVVDEDDDPGLSDELERRADVVAGVVVVRPVPGVADTRGLAADVLIALGKHYDCLTRERQSRHGWELVRLWVRAEDLRHLVVWDAQRLAPTLWRELEALGAATGGRVWMVVRPELAPGAGGRRADGCTPVELLSEIPVQDTGDGALLDETVVLPQEDFLTFRWACVQRLSRKQFAQVDAIYVAAHEATRKWLESRRWQDRPERGEVVRQLRALNSQSGSSTETLVRLRAAQAAYFRDGVLVEIDDARPLARPAVPATGLTRPVAGRLRRLVTPAWACALTLVTVAGMTATDLARLRVGDVYDGTVMTLGGESFDVPAHAVGLVRAQLLGRSDRGVVAPGDPLFLNGDQPFESAPLRRRVENAARLAGVWRPSEERRPLWQRAPVDGYTVRLVALDGNWEATASA